jgi:hypothetical protein
MPLAASKPTINTLIEIRMATNGPRKNGEWDGANWWVEVQSGSAKLPIKESFIKEWRYPV